MACLAAQKSARRARRWDQRARPRQVSGTSSRSAFAATGTAACAYCKLKRNTFHAKPRRIGPATLGSLFSCSRKQSVFANAHGQPVTEGARARIEHVAVVLVVPVAQAGFFGILDRKSTRLNS